MRQESATVPDEPIQETQFSRPTDGDTGAATRSLFGNIDPTRNYGSTSRSHSQAQGSRKAPRVLAPDLLRGLLMILQALDHGSVISGAWRHGQALESEADGQVVDTWNDPVPWIVRTLTHLCAPGFMFLLGMGVVYFGRSRSKLGWSSWQMIKHFFIRALVLAIVNQVLGLMIIPGRLMLVNIVLLALAVNYLLAGLIWLAMTGTERFVCDRLAPIFTSSEDQPLLSNERANSPAPKKSAWVEAISFHLHNTILLILAFITIWWNVWLSPNHGHCQLASSPLQSLAVDSPVTKPLSAGPQAGGKSMTGHNGPGFDFWFYPLHLPTVLSGFPPLAWLSFALFGLLYARLALARPRAAATVNTANVFAGIAFFLLFALTRIFRVGNLSEDCLRMPEHIAHPHGNQYLQSFRSFFYIAKYPPSPAYLCFTMSVNHFLLAGFGAIPEKVARRIPMLLVFGTSALFFYAVHLPLYSALGTAAKALFGHKLGYDDPMGGGGEAVGVGNGWVFWIMWSTGLAVLYPLCRWYGAFKAGREPDSVWRFF